MPQSPAQILVHIVFFTKHRERIIADAIRDEFHACTGDIIANLSGTQLKAGSVEDHVHLLAAYPRTCLPADFIQEIKTGTSKWIKTQGTRYRDFHWQLGYGMFSISPAHRRAVESYLEGQSELHKTEAFQDEYRRLMRKYGIEFDERYVWD